MRWNELTTFLMLFMVFPLFFSSTKFFFLSCVCWIHHFSSFPQCFFCRSFQLSKTFFFFSFASIVSFQTKPEATRMKSIHFAITIDACDFVRHQRFVCHCFLSRNVVNARTIRIDNFILNSAFHHILAWNVKENHETTPTTILFFRRFPVALRLRRSFSFPVAFAFPHNRQSWLLIRNVTVICGIDAFEQNTRRAECQQKNKGKKINVCSRRDILRDIFFVFSIFIRFSTNLVFNCWLDFVVLRQCEHGSRSRLVSICHSNTQIHIIQALSLFRYQWEKALRSAIFVFITSSDERLFFFLDEDGNRARNKSWLRWDFFCSFRSVCRCLTFYFILFFLNACSAWMSHVHSSVATIKRARGYQPLAHCQRTKKKKNEK